MKKIKQITTGMCVIFCMVTSIPAFAAAEDTSAEKYADTLTQPLDLTGGSTSGNGYIWNSETYTLTLNGLLIDLTGNTADSAVKLPNNNTTIIVNGANKIIGGAKAIEIASGSGTVTIKNKNSDGRADNSLIIEDSAAAFGINDRITPFVWENVTFESNTGVLAKECPYGVTFKNSVVSITANSAGSAIDSEKIIIENSELYAKNKSNNPVIFSMGYDPNFIIKVTDSKVTAENPLNCGIDTFAGAIEVTNSVMDFTRTIAGMGAQRYITVTDSTVSVSEGRQSACTFDTNITSEGNTGNISIRGSSTINGIIRTDFGTDQCGIITVDDTVKANAIAVEAGRNAYKVYGEYTLPGNMTVAEGGSISIPENATLIIPEDKTLTLNGTMTNNGVVLCPGTLNTDSDAYAGSGKLITKLWQIAAYMAQPETDYVIDENGNYTVLTAKGLAKIADIVNNGDSLEGKTVTLNNDIDLLDEDVTNYADGTVTERNSWIPIGESGNSFKGTFDGAGHKISNLFVVRNDANAGLFGTNAGVIRNLELASGKIELNINPGHNNSEYSAGMTAVNANTISGCINRAEVKASSTTTTDTNKVYIGGIAGLNNNSTAILSTSIADCKNYGSISGTGGTLTQYYGGGICGYYYGGMIADRISTLDRCANYGTVTITDCHTAQAGGIAGYQYAQSATIKNVISNCFNEGQISGNAGYCMTGGIAGYSQSYSSILNCYNKGAVTGNKNNGGIVGLSTAAIANCYNSGTVTGGTNGGVVGKQNSGTIFNCYYLDTSANNAAGSGTLTSSCAFTSANGVNTLSAEADIEGITTTDLTDALNLYVNKKLAGGQYYAWQSADSTPVFGGQWIKAINTVLKKITVDMIKDQSEATAVLSEIMLNGTPISSVQWTYNDYNAEYSDTTISGNSTVYFGIVIPELLEESENSTTDKITVTVK